MITDTQTQKTKEGWNRFVWWAAVFSVVLNIIFFLSIFNLSLGDNIKFSNFVDYENKCNNSLKVGGVYPFCLNNIKVSDYNNSNKLRVGVVCLAYGADSYVNECFEQLMDVAKIFSSSSGIDGIDDMNITFILFKGPNALNNERENKLYNTWNNNNLIWNFMIRIISINAPKPFKKWESETNSQCHASAAYKHMNAFRTKFQFEDKYMINSDFTYLWQLDSNLKIKTIPCNPFKVMIKSRAMLGYWNGGIEEEKCRTNFTQIVLEYAIKYNLLLSGTGLTDSFAASGGSLIFHMRFFTSLSYKHFINMVWNSGLIYKTRLSDQVIYQYSLAIISGYTDNLHLFSGWTFCHGGWGGCDVYTDKAHPLWHINEKDPFCQSNITKINQLSKYLENKWIKRRSDNLKVVKINKITKIKY